jgi:hypothetical protein
MTFFQASFNEDSAMTIIRSFQLLAGLFLACAATGQDVDSGPEIGKKIPALKVFDATGPKQDKEVDYAAERKDKPTVYIFVRADKWDRPMARFLRKLDEILLKENEEAYIVAVWLSDDVEKTKGYLPRAQQSLNFQNTALTCFTGEKAGPKDWGINPDAHVTVVVACKSRAAKKLGYRSINETDAPAVQEALKNAISGK